MRVELLLVLLATAINIHPTRLHNCVLNPSFLCNLKEFSDTLYLSIPTLLRFSLLIAAWQSTNCIRAGSNNPASRGFQRLQKSLFWSFKDVSSRWLPFAKVNVNLNMLPLSWHERELFSCLHHLIVCKKFQIVWKKL